MEVLVRLVPATVFKTVGTSVKLASGGFDSHALPPFNSEDSLRSDLNTADIRAASWQVKKS